MQCQSHKELAAASAYTPLPVTRYYGIIFLTIISNFHFLVLIVPIVLLFLLFLYPRPILTLLRMYSKMFGKIVERTDQGLHYRCNGVVYTGIDIQASLFAIHVHGNPRVREEYSTLDTLDALDATPEPTSMCIVSFEQHTCVRNTIRYKSHKK